MRRNALKNTYRPDSRLATSVLAVTMACIVLLSASPAFAAEGGGGPLSDGIAPVPAQASSFSAECTPVEILAFRGSGEAKGPGTYAGTTLQSNGWEGKTLHRLLEAYVTQSRGTSTPNPLVDEIPVRGIGPSEFGAGSGYPAVAVPRTVDASRVKKVIGDSARAGALSTAAYIDGRVQAAQATGCPRPRFVVLGYSQGAIAARWLTQLRPNDVALSQLFGDPLQWEKRSGNRGTGAGGNGFLRYISTDPEKLQDNKYYALTKPAKSTLCHKGDPFCDYNWLLVGVLAILFEEYKPHLNYITSPAEITQEAQTTAGTVANLAAAVSAATPYSDEPERNYTNDIDVDAFFANDATSVVNPNDPGSFLPAPRSLGPALGPVPLSHEGITVHAGNALELSVDGIPAGSQFGLRITNPAAEGSWQLPALWASNLYTSTGGTQQIKAVPTGLPPGSYTASVLTDTFTHSPDIPLTITSVDPEPETGMAGDTSSPPPAAAAGSGHDPNLPRTNRSAQTPTPQPAEATTLATTGSAAANLLLPGGVTATLAGLVTIAVRRTRQRKSALK